MQNCIIDFCGTHGADFILEENVVRFGGDWQDVPDMPCESAPTQEAVREWAKSHLEE